MESREPVYLRAVVASIGTLKDFGVILDAGAVDDLNVLALALECADRFSDAIECEDRGAVVARIVRCLEDNLGSPQEAALPEEVYKKWMDLRLIAERNGVTKQVCEIGLQISTAGDIAKTTHDVREHIRNALIEGELCADLYFLFLRGKTRGELEAFFRLATATNNLLDNIIDAKADRANQALGFDPSFQFYCLSAYQCFINYMKLFAKYPKKRKAVLWVLKSLVDSYV